MDEWINKMRYKHVMKYYATLRKGILIHAMTWRKLEGISLVSFSCLVMFDFL